MSTRKPPAEAQQSPPRKGGPEARREAMGLLVEGHQVLAVAEVLGVDEKTVRRWRDSPEGQREMEVSRKAREASFADAADSARRILREAATRAAQVLADQLEDRDAEVRNRAARAILDRTGVPRTERVETTASSPVDLSRLTDEEFAQLEALHRKAARG